MAIELLFLGTGTSHGIPVPGCACSVCTSADSRNKRMRASVLFCVDGKNILVDTATEFRLQATTNHVDHVDAVLITHDHADHLHGLDDIRPYSEYSPIPLYALPEINNEIRSRFPYMFSLQEEGGGIPNLVLRDIIDGQFAVADIPVIPIPLFHGTKSILGFRMGNVAYCTDCSKIPENSYALLAGLDILVIDALRLEPHSTHFSVAEALEEIQKIKPKRAYFTHLCHKLDHSELQKSLPKNVFAAYDGLRLISQ